MARLLAGLDDLRVWVSEDQADDGKALAALGSASTLVRVYTERFEDWGLADAPDAVREATVNVARRRALTPENGITDQSAGPFSVKRDTGLWLSA
ncbi:MAG: hypothetical protein LC799_25285, partial [Actinobacteria bacterium]|nr:hypothetical protein [Actinomycetota bacterium]